MNTLNHIAFIMDGNGISSMNTLNHIAFIMDGNGRWGLRKKKKSKLWSFKRC